MTSNESENVPLQETPPSSPTGGGEKVKTKGFQLPGFYLSKTKLIILAVVILVLILLIIILAAFLGHANAKLAKGKSVVYNFSAFCCKNEV